MVTVSLADAPGRPRRAARRPARHRRPLPPVAGYGQSKLANLLFTYELDRRARRAELPVRALAAHPGFAGTHLAANGQYGRSSGGIASILDAGDQGGLAAGRRGRLADADGGHRRPARRDVLRPGRARASCAALPAVVGQHQLSHDEAAQRRLWELSEETTGIRYP